MEGLRFIRVRFVDSFVRVAGLHLPFLLPQGGILLLELLIYNAFHSNLRQRTITTPMAAPLVYPPPTGFDGCYRCRESFYTVEEQQSARRQYMNSCDRNEAQQWLDTEIQTARQHLQRVRERLHTHGDVILSRWKKKNYQRRAILLSAASRDLLGEWPVDPQLMSEHARRDPWGLAERHHGLAIWLRLDSIAEDYMKFLSLLHVRCQYDLSLWSTFDTTESRLSWGPIHNRHSHCNASVIMHGNEYGKLVDFEVDAAHSGATVGFPRATVTVTAQSMIAKMLSRGIDLIIGDAAPSGSTRWNDLMSGDMQNNEQAVRVWSPYHDQPYTTPPKFEIGVLVDKVQSHLNLIVDEIELMQTSPEHFRQRVMADKASVWNRHLAAKNEDDQWAFIAYINMCSLQTSIILWQRVLAECKHLQAKLSQAGSSMKPGSRLSKDADAAMRAFGHGFKDWYSWNSAQISHALLSMGDVRKHTLTNLMRPTYPFGQPIDPETKLDPSKQGHRIFKTARVMQREMFVRVQEEMPCSMEFYVRKLKSELDQIPYSRAMDFCLSDTALLDELRLSWCWHQMINYHDPPGTSTTRVDLSITNLMPADFASLKNGVFKSSLEAIHDRQRGRLLRKFYETSMPRGRKNHTWLEKMTKVRDYLKQFWENEREMFRKSQASLQRPDSYVEGILENFCFDLSSEHLARLEAERQQIESDEQQAKATRAQRKSRPAFIQQDWDNRTEEDGITRRKRTKAKAARDITEMKPEPDDPTRDQQATADVSTVLEPTQVPTILVNKETYNVFAKIFPTGASVSESSVRWLAFQKAMEDAGMTVAHNGGSKVTFTCQEGRICFHKPHPDPTVDAVMLRSFGQRLSKWFGWTNDTFVMREKNGDGRKKPE